MNTSYQTWLLGLILLTACVNSELPKPTETTDQVYLNKLLSNLKQDLDTASNAAQEDEKIEMHKGILKKYLIDSLKGAITSHVNVGSVSTMPWRGKTALMFKADAGNVNYWMEEHFQNDDSMRASGLYKIVSGIPEKADTTLSFVIYPDEIELKAEKYLTPSLRVMSIVVPDTIVNKYRKRVSN